MREIYDRSLVHDFHYGDISLIFRNEDEFRKFMEYLEYDYGIEIGWGDNSRPIMKSDIFARRYGDNTILKLVTNTDHKILYGIYDATKYIFGFADMYIDEIICGAPVEINADLLADFLGGV